MPASDKDLIESVYAVALEPERYEELLEIWKSKIITSLELEKPAAPALDDDIRRSLKILDTLSPDISTDISLLAGTKDVRFPVCAVDQNLLIIEANTAAIDAYGQITGQRLSSLPFTAHAITALKKNLLRTLMHSDLAHVELVRAVKPGQGGVSLISIRKGSISEAQPPFVVLQTSDFVWPSALLPLLQNAFHLTPAEAEIIRLLVQGKTLAEIATLRQSAVSTVRSQMRSIFDKTDTHSQTELVRMAIAFASLHEDILVDAEAPNGQCAPLAHIDVKGAYRPQPNDRTVFALPDGRSLDYAVFGAQDGKPVLFVHCAFFGDIWPAQTVRLAKERGLKIIAPSRAFYQRSSPCPPNSQPAKVFAEDVRHLLNHLDVDQFVILTRNIGSQYGFELALQQPDRARGVVAVSPAMPTRHDDAYVNAEANQRFLASAAMYFPSLLELFVKSAHIYFSRVSPKTFIEKTFKASRHDFHILSDPEILAAMTAGLNEAGRNANAVKAFMCSYTDLSMHSFETVRDFQRPLAVLVGEYDISPRLELVHQLKAEGAALDFIELADTAEFGFYTQPEVMLDAVYRIWN